jgi:hypothetical protein
MRCFNHPEREAVGICKSCSKGICSDCASDLGHGLACRDKHEPNVESLNTMIVRSSRVQATTTRAKYVAPAFTAFMGAMFLGYGYFKEGLSGFLAPLGIGFLVYSVALFVANRKAWGRVDRDA